MKKYEKPVLEIVELKVKENLANKNGYFSEGKYVYDKNNKRAFTEYVFNAFSS